MDGDSAQAGQGSLAGNSADQLQKEAKSAWEDFERGLDKSFIFSYRKNFKKWIQFLTELKQPDFLSEHILKTIENGSSKSKQISQKSLEQAEECRKRGNTFFSLKCFEISLMMYNKALTLYPWNENKNPSIGTIYANRSAVFLELGRYNEALNDIELATKFDYPDNLKWKILVRKAKILLNIGKAKSEIMSFIEDSKKLIDEVWHMKFDMIEEKLENTDANNYKKSTFNEEIEWMNTRKYFTTPYVENPEFINASSKVSLDFGENNRCVKANCQIQQGEILFDEEPFASILSEEYRNTHCHHCQVDMLNYMIPCKCCSSVRYCSENCAKPSWDQYHQYECMYEPFLQSLGLGHLATRMVLIAGVEKVLETVRNDPLYTAADQLTKEAVIQIMTQSVDQSMNEFIKETGTDYDRVYSLVEHTIYGSTTSFPFLQTAVTCLQFLKLRTDFFSNSSDDDIYDVGAVILLHLFQLDVNAQKIYTLPSTFEKGFLDTGERIAVGSAIFASTSMMNHSCNPKISTSYKLLSGQGRRLIVKALNMIDSGTEICNAYGLSYRKHDKLHRREDLYKKHYFWCKCDICCDEAETMWSYTFLDNFSKFLCEKKDSENCSGFVRGPLKTAGGHYWIPSSFVCSNSNSKHEQKFSFKIIDEIGARRGAFKIYMERGDLENAFNMLKIALEHGEKVLHPDHYLIAEIKDEIAKFLLQQGQPTEAMPYLEASLGYAEKRYGSFSIEYGMKLRTYAEVLQLLGKTEDEKVGSEKSKTILEIHCPST